MTKQKLEAIDSEVESNANDGDGIPVLRVQDTNITFRGQRLLLETDDQETLDAFKTAYHKLERYYLGDYGE